MINCSESVGCHRASVVADGAAVGQPLFPLQPPRGRRFAHARQPLPQHLARAGQAQRGRDVVSGEEVVACDELEQELIGQVAQELERRGRPCNDGRACVSALLSRRHAR